MPWSDAYIVFVGLRRKDSSDGERSCLVWSKGAACQTGSASGNAVHDWADQRYPDGDREAVGQKVGQNAGYS